MEEKDNPKLYRIRHSMAHVLAQAVIDRWPQAKLGFGPPTDTGFFYDFDFGGEPVTDADLKDLEKRMKKITGHKAPFERIDGNYDDAVKTLSAFRDEPYKQENLKNLRDRGETNFSFYKSGRFLDVCEGPHVEHTGLLPVDAFKLDRIAGAYWLGDEKNKMLTRIYALCFETKEELTQYLERRAMALEFDHKKLGRELDIYQIEDIIGKGLPLWLPNGAIIRKEIERYAEEMEFKYDYKRVATPHIAKESLYLKSQHLPAYEESMFPPMVVTDEEDKKERFFLKPMNCPHHHMIYAARNRSYRELPLRLAEYGTCYRYEQSGELSGLLRVRCLTMNDAHIYCRHDQLETELKNVLKMYLEFYDTFKLSKYRFRLSLRGTDNADKYKGDLAMWDKAGALLEKVLVDEKADYYRAEGEAAFYGPKIDIQFKNLMGREETVSTIQVDFLSPVNFELGYVDETGGQSPPAIIHRAPLSTHERFVSFLLEYYGGAFPTWCAPTQVAMIPVNDSCLPYCQELAATLKGKMVRAEIDSTDNSFNKKIRNNTVRKIPIVLVVGAKEVEERTVTIRRYGIKDQVNAPRDQFVTDLLEEIRDRRMLREPMSAIT